MQSNVLLQTVLLLVEDTTEFLVECRGYAGGGPIVIGSLATICHVLSALYGVKSALLPAVKLWYTDVLVCLMPNLLTFKRLNCVFSVCDLTAISDTYRPKVTL